ncbi:carbohydrate-binding module family 20 domain-containing protein [Cellulomonas oligotrophica]|uniref:Alpha-amylase n=1 Tax=Cellulomonas oligotrophica TaxID=931536 RepID=A0A7Y9FGI6_9CELL|nr:carbohydrate-binding module family 20 domain-containing protein [Cellulomonas oligotrophica]NYD86482.1 alpha-amylase [Cellulomonas oligotrophica]GIG32627.1 hypothetical protein Col01nite_17860 [Cellulomonas oligotrophica]
MTSHHAPPRPGALAAPRGTRRSTPVIAALAALATVLAGLVGVVTADRSRASAPVNGDGDVVLNMFQWTWDAVAAECATIGDAGFGYVQVSPPQEHVTGSQWWTSYQPVSYRVDSKLGTRAEFAAMNAACDAAGVGVIADAVINHTTGADRGSGTGVAGTAFGVDSFPGVPYGPNDFNDCRTNITNYGDRYQVQNCRLVSLQDLRTGSDYVRGKIAAYLNDLIGLGVDGFRIDAAKHMPAADLAAIKQRLSRPDVYWVQEVIGAAGEPIRPAEYVGSGDVHEFDYARRLKERFDGSIKDLRTVGDGLLPSAQAGVFVDNHDTERNGETMTYAWGAKYVLANTFMLAYPYGSPSVYTGYRFTDKDAGAPGATSTTVPDASCANSQWTCTHRMTEVRGMVGFHNAVAGTGLTNWWDDGGNLVAFGRGAKGHVVLNNTASAQSRTYTTSLPDGTYCDVVASGACTRTVAVSGGRFTASVPAYGALALHVDARSGATPTPTPTPTATGTTGLTFAVNATTTWGQNIYAVGDQPALGSWAPASGVALSASTYPVWRGAVTLPPGTRVEYKYVRIDGSGGVTWETGANRVVTVPASGRLTLNDTWRG